MKNFSLIFSILISICTYLNTLAFAEAFDEPMSFRIAMTGGNCNSCIWIVAEGVVKADTPEKFAAYAENLVTREQRFKSLDGVNVHLNSPGGNLIGGVRLGQLFRQLKVNTVVSATITQEILQSGEHVVSDSTGQELGECSSACVFAFAGGIVRYASQDTLPEEVGFRKLGRLGVHQFYNPNALSDPSAKVLTAADAIEDQKIISILLRHLDQMGVSAELLQLSSATKPSDMLYLTDEELSRTRVDTWSVRNLFIRGYKNGVATIELQYARRNADYRLELYCEKGQLKMLANIEWRGFYDTSGHKNWRFFQNLTIAQANNMPSITLRLTQEEFSLSKEKTAGKFRFVFEGVPLKSLVKLKEFRFQDSNSHWASDAARELVFSLPANFHGLYIMPKACK